ncbi:MAG: 5-oxoprolinase subunit PxpA [Thermoanaerobaculia bacterium]
MPIDLNADLGEATDLDGRERELALLGLVTSASLACGGHAGDRSSMAAALAAAASHGVVVGAHPAYLDREYFGRRELGTPVGELLDQTLTQIRELVDLGRSMGIEVRYVKPHGALYHRLGRDLAAARAVVTAISRLGGRLWLLGLAGSELERACDEARVPFAREGFLDRAYEPSGGLVPRDESGAVLEDSGLVAERAVAFARGAAIRDRRGAPLRIPAESICVHGDTPRALELLGAARAALERAGVAIRPFVA